MVSKTIVPYGTREFESRPLRQLYEIQIDQVIWKKGTNKKVINKRSDALYYILEGKGEFNIDGENITVSVGDLVFIPKGTPYFD